MADRTSSRSSNHQSDDYEREVTKLRDERAGVVGRMGWCPSPHRFERERMHIQYLDDGMPIR